MAPARFQFQTCEGGKIAPPPPGLASDSEAVKSPQKLRTIP